MKHQIIALNSDTLNRYNMVFPVSTLEASLKDTFQEGISSCIGHDIHKAYGLIYPMGLYFEPHVTRLLGINLIPENKDDQKVVNSHHKYNVLSRVNEGFEKYGDKLMPLVEGSIVEKWFKVDPSCTAIYNPGLASRHFEALFLHKDDAGLIPLQTILDEFTYLGEGVFKHKHSECCLFAHSYFRRSQSVYNNFHFYFLNELLSLAGNKDICIKLCLDENMIGYAPSFRSPMELEFHWGPKFNDDIASIKHGITRHECDAYERSFCGITSTEFYWKTDEHEKTFELEELKDDPTPTSEIETYHCRYMHSIYDTSLQTFVHFDGAIRSYGLEQMYERIGVDFLTYGRKAVYKKLFRIDGKLPLHSWKLLVTHYMQDNPLIYEYFGVGEEREAQKILGKELNPVQHFLPFAIGKDAGIRLLVSYFKKPEDLKEGRYIEIFDQIMEGDQPRRTAEHFIYEIKKALLHVGGDLDIPSDVLLLKVSDRYINVPSIMHYGPGAEKLFTETVSAYCLLFEAMQSLGKDFDISITFSFVISERLVRISAYGHLTQIFDWLKNSMPCPFTDKEFSEWITKQRTYLQSFASVPDNPVITSLAKSDGVIYVKRKAVPFKYDFFEDDRGLGYEIEMPPNDPVHELINAGTIQPCIVQIVKQMEWSDTGDDYFQGSRSKWLDYNDDVSVLITEAAPVMLMWSTN